MESQRRGQQNLANGNSVYTGRPPWNDNLTTSTHTKGFQTSLIAPLVFEIPASLIVSAAAFREFMRKNRLDKVLEGLLVGVDVNRLQELQQPARQIQAVIRSSPLPDGVYDRITEWRREMGYGTTVVWPVTMASELFQWSSEFQGFPYLQAANTEELLAAVRHWWASLFDATTMFLRERYGHRHRDARITVAAQQLPGSGASGFLEPMPLLSE